MSLTALLNGASGLAANSTALDVVGNNLANLNTTGYKTQRVLFKDLVYQTLDSGSPGNANFGGTNAMQQGFGVQVGSIDSTFQQGAVNPTTNPLDAALSGPGFFVTKGGAQTFFTRTGAFSLDANGFLVDPTSGNFVQRVGTAGELTATTPGFQVPGDNNIKIPFGIGTPGVATTKVNFQGNFSKNLNIGDTFQTSIQVFDSTSQGQVLNVTFTKSGINTFTASATIGSGGTVTVPSTPISFDTQGLLVSPATLTATISGIPGTAAQTVTFNLGTPGTATGLSQFGGTSTATAITQDGTSAGTLSAVSIDQAGIIRGQFTNGKTFAVAQLAVAAFNNEGGLIRAGENNFVVGPSSGEPLIGTAGDGGRGNVQGSALEGSNVDIATEFARLIIAQRGFQVNSKSITVASETLQTLADLIR